MLITKEILLKQSKDQFYKPEILEKVFRLLDIFQQILSVPYLKDRLVLKGGTALNLFHFDQLPRLSVDIDLNYIGQLDRDKMLDEKLIIIDAIQKILLQNQFERYRSPMHHAGGKMVWYYNSVLGQRGTLEIDINFMYRQPLFPLCHQSAKLEYYDNFEVPILDIHELAAGKLSALFSRTASRDLFDAHYLLKQTTLDINKLRKSFVVYLGMTKIDVLSLLAETIKYDLTDLKNRLLPVMHQKNLPRNSQQLKLWAAKMATELQEELSKLLPLNTNEIEFIQKIRTEGKIQPTLITDDLVMANNIQSHPALHWAIKQWSLDKKVISEK